MTVPTLCPSCQNALEPDDRFCGKCGATVNEAGADPPPEPQADPAAAAALEDALREALAPRYLLVRLLGAGGMGSVYVAREPALKRLVAVKVLSHDLSADPKARARFQRESQAVAGISHPNVVSIYAVGELADGTPYFVMQHVAGESLSARLERDGPVAPAEGRRLLGQIASALAAAHAKGIIHRDIKPANVLYDAESGRALVTDFGIAAVLPSSDADAPTHLTGTGMAIGTPQYMSPEQLLAEQVTEKTDIYSLGLLAYELLTGAGPFSISSPREIMAAHLRDTPRRLSEIKSDVDHELESLVAASLRKNPDERPTAAELEQRLGAAETVLEWPPPGLDTLQGATDRLTRGFAVASLLLVGPLLLMIASGMRLAGAGAGVLVVVLVVAAAVGAALLFPQALRARRLGRDASRAVRQGYGWLTVAEVVTDQRGDTGALIAGTREYAGLSPGDRDRFRAARVASALARLLAALLLCPMLVLALAFGPRGSAGSLVTTALVLLPTLALVLASGSLGVAEDRALRTTRARKRGPAKAGPPGWLADAWYVSFETARRGQRQGAGPKGRPALARVATLAVALGTAVAALLLLPVLILLVVGPVLSQSVVPKLSNPEQRQRRADTLRPWRLATDSSITPLEAGHAWAMMNGSSAGGNLFRTAPNLGPGIDWFPEDTAFGTNPYAVLYDGDSMILRAFRGFSPAERAYLADVADNPGFRHLATLGRAPGLDRIGALFVLPLPDSAMWLDLPIPRFAATREVGYAGIARAAWLVSQGRRPEAETAIREVISFGLLIIDESSTIVESLIGESLTRTARVALLRFLDATGRGAEARTLRAAYDVVVARGESPGRAAETIDPFVVDLPSLRRNLIAQVADPSRNTGLRWELLVVLRLQQCGNAQELLFGPDAELQAAMDSAKQQLVQTAGEAALFELIEAIPARFPERFVPEGIARVLYRAVQLDGKLLRNPRIPGCLGPLIANLFAPVN